MNGPCPCGSGKKYKRCCGAQAKSDERTQALRQLVGATLQAYEQGDLTRAERLIGQALTLAPNDPGLLGIKGMTLFRLGRLDAANACISRAIEINPKDSRLWNFRGQVQARLRRNEGYVEAERAFGHAVELDPSFAEAWHNLGQVQLSTAKPYEAIESFRQALRRAPDERDSYVHLALAHYLMHELPDARAAIERAVALGLDATQAALLQALLLRAEGRIAEADALRARTTVADTPGPGHVGLLREIGQIELLAGNMAEAVYWLKQAQAAAPDDEMIYYHLSSACKFSATERDLVANMERLAGVAKEPARHRLEFALGKAYADLGEHNRAFQHYKTGNDLVRATVPFDATAFRAETEAIIARRRGHDTAPGSDSPLPVLIVGTPRSGTSLVEQIISSHSQAAGAGELDFWGRIAGTPDGYSQAQRQRLAEDYLAILRRHAPGALRITDKQPLNYQCLDTILSVFPNARIVHCQRHPIDACLSIYFQLFDRSQAYKWDEAGLVVFYEAYQRLMAHWRAVLPPENLYELRYEKLVDDLEGESRRLMTFLGLAWEPGQLEFYKQTRSVFTPSKWQVRQPIYTTSKARWRRYEKHLGPLLELLRYAPD
ncbi:sulfotransferase [Parasulfuritortus cantonensis]|uniref:sulfotransferase n=1 Tax=Parasulfuritortus cantonensis TaxID=2528202 RepID=UPI00140510F2|nr:sulfotransferase [Parasulfuritortus cantonensis]